MAVSSNLCVVKKKCFQCSFAKSGNFDRHKFSIKKHKSFQNCRVSFKQIYVHNFNLLRLKWLHLIVLKMWCDCSKMLKSRRSTAVYDVLYLWKFNSTFTFKSLRLLSDPLCTRRSSWRRKSPISRPWSCTRTWVLSETSGYSDTTWTGWTRCGSNCGSARGGGGSPGAAHL